MPDIKTIADKADVIINGYAFTRKDDCEHGDRYLFHPRFIENA